MVDAPRARLTLNRAEWTAHNGAPEPATAPMPPIGAEEWREVYAPLAVWLSSRVDRRPAVIGLAGSVSAGKSTCAAAIARLLGPAEVVSTDGFIFPNSVLEPRGLLMRKGFPESYDVELIASVFGDLWAGRAVEVPVYSHEVYDIVGSRVIGPAAVVIVEGVNALGPFAPWCDVGIFLDASEVDLRDWYVERFAALVASGAPFYQQFAGTDVRGVAESVWEAVNLPNLREHILPTRSRADLVLHKGADHAVVAVTLG